MTAFSILPLSGAISLLIMAVFVYMKNRTSPINFTYTLFSLSMILWLIGFFISYLTMDQKVAYFWQRLGYSGVILIPSLVYSFFVEFLEMRKLRFSSIVNVGISLGFIVILWTTDLLVDGMQKYHLGFYYIKASTLQPYFLAFFVLCFVEGYLMMFLKYREHKKNSRFLECNRIWYVVVAILIGNVASIDFIPMHGVQLWPFGFLFMIIMVCVIAYAIVRHQLMDIEVVIRRAVVFAGLFGFVYAVFAGAAYLTQELFAGVFGANRWLAMVPSIAIIIIGLDPLKRLLISLTDRFLFQKKYNYRDLLKTFSNEVLTVLDLDVLVNMTVNSLAKIIRLETCSLFLANKEKETYELRAFEGIRDLDVKLDNQHALINYFRMTHTYLLNTKSLDTLRDSAAVKLKLKELKAELILPVFLHDELMAIVVLGRKKSGEDYNQDDLDILVPLAQSLAVAISNARLFKDNTRMLKDLAQMDKMKAIATLAAGMAHEIKNPLTSIKTFTEYLPKQYDNPEFREKFNRIVTPEVERIDNIVKNILSFSKPQEPRQENLDLKKALEDVSDLLSNEFIRRNIKVNKAYNHNKQLIKGDYNQLKQAFLNVILNAIEAMPSGGELIIETQATNNRLQTTISDTGVGISEEDQKHLFDPFFSKKDQGTGLGLAVVQGIIEKHNAKIAVESQPGIGTTFTLEFPVAERATTKIQ